MFRHTIVTRVSSSNNDELAFVELDDDDDDDEAAALLFDNAGIVVDDADDDDDDDDDEDLKRARPSARAMPRNRNARQRLRSAAPLLGDDAVGAVDATTFDADESSTALTPDGEDDTHAPAETSEQPPRSNDVRLRQHATSRCTTSS